jgi:hypothetical protein
MKLSNLILSIAMITAPLLALGADSMDSDFHSQVTQKVQHDHAADMKSGAVHGRRSHARPISAPGTTSAASTTTSVASGGTSGTLAHPAQVQQAQHKKHAPPPVPKNTH